MLRGTYRNINPFSKLFLLLILVISFMLFSSLTGILVLVPFYGTEVLNLLSAPDYSNPTVVNALKVLQIFNMAGGLLLPALVFYWLVTPSEEKITGLSAPVNLTLILMSVLFVVVAQPLIGFAGEINSYLTLPDWLQQTEIWMKGKEEMGAQLTEAFLSTTTIEGLFINVFMIAILPAIAEEILFRGVIAKLFHDLTKNIHWAVFISSFIFAAIHLQFYGFLPRFLLGAAFGYLFFWSGSLWLPVAAHFINNFLSVIIEFLYRKQIIQTNAENFGTDSSLWLILISITGVLFILIYIKLNSCKKETGNKEYL